MHSSADPLTPAGSDHAVYAAATEVFDARLARSGEEILDSILSLPE